MDDKSKALSILKAQGFAQIQANLKFLGSGRGDTPKADLVCWESRDGETLEPVVVVSVVPEDQASVLENFAELRNVIGSLEHYLFVDSTWYKADAAMMTLIESDPPSQKWIENPDALIADPYLIDIVLGQALRAKTPEIISAAQNDSLGSEASTKMARYLSQIVLEGLPIEAGRVRFSPVESLLILPKLIHPLMSQSILSISDSIVETMAVLAGDHAEGIVVDPFIGLGTSVWGLFVGETRPEKIIGGELQTSLFEAAQELSKLSPVPVELKLGDSFREHFSSEADLVITIPPFGILLEERMELQNGEFSRDGNVIAIDRGVRFLKPGGRLVIQLPADFLNKASSSRYRDYLSENHHVAAIIGIPEEVTPGTRIRTFLLVVDKQKSGKTFVANIGSDWNQQLKRGSSLLDACIGHLGSDLSYE